MGKFLKVMVFSAGDSGGALEILLNRTIRANCQTLARRMEYIELDSRPDFQDIFADSLMF